MQSEAPSRLDKYELLGRLGHGGMAEVFLARQSGPMGFEKLVAVKRLLPHLRMQEHFVRMFLDEARIAARINHANVVQIFDLGHSEDSYYIAMEYLEGESLARVMGEGIRRGMPLTPLICAFIISQMCKGLNHAHNLTGSSGELLGLVHRDVSPQNVVILYDGGVKLLDFGIAKARERLTETTTTGLKGKYAYMSPEQCLGRPVDRRSDIFACGIVLWELLTRRRLYKHSSKLMILKMITEGKVAPPSSLNPEVNKQLDEVVLRSLSHDPNARFTTADEMSEAIDDVLAESGTRATTTTLAEHMQLVFGEEARARADLTAAALSSSPSGEGAIQPKQTAEYWLNMIPEPSQETVFFSTSVPTSAVTSLPRTSARWWIATALVATAAAVAALVLLVISSSASGDSRLRIGSDPPGALVIIDGKPHAKRTPTTVGSLSKGKHKVTIRLANHQPWRRTIELDNNETLRIEVTLERLGAIPTRADSRAGPGPGDAGAAPKTGPPDATVVALKKDARAKKPRRPKTPPKHTRRPRGHGLLNLATQPWATVYHGKRKLGNTPLIRVRLPAGKVRLTAVNRQARIRKKFTVVIRKNQLSRQRIILH